MRSTLNIDLFFFAALQQSTELCSLVDDRIFDTFRNSTAEQQDKVPYIIVTTGVTTVDQQTNDEYTASLNRGSVTVLCVGGNTNELANLQKLVLDAISSANANEQIYNAHPDWDFDHLYITPSTGEKMADPDKPCMFRELYFACEM